MDYQPFFNIAIGLCSLLGGWWLRIIHESLKELRDEDKLLADKVGRIEVLVAGQYVTREEMDKTVCAMFKKLDKIEELLYSKADKP